jgi:hypothetical protein
VLANLSVKMKKKHPKKMKIMMQKESCGCDRAPARSGRGAAGVTAGRPAPAERFTTHVHMLPHFLRKPPKCRAEELHGARRENGDGDIFGPTLEYVYKCFPDQCTAAGEFYFEFLHEVEFLLMWLTRRVILNGHQ